MIKTLLIAPYTVNYETEGRASSLTVHDEHGTEVTRANYDGFLKRYREINITTNNLVKVSEIVTVLDQAALDINLGNL